MPLAMECPNCEDNTEFTPDDSPDDENLPEETEEVPRINLKCSDCGHKVRIWDTGITSLFS